MCGQTSHFPRPPGRATGLLIGGQSPDPAGLALAARAGARQYGRHFSQLVAACGAQLNHTWRSRGGGWVHASDLFNTAYSAPDVARVLRALRLGRVDLYGDSYGSWFAQVFASRYPGLLRSVTLDSTYRVLGLDPWYTTTVVTARRAFAQACQRSVACAAATRGGRQALRAATVALASVGDEVSRWPLLSDDHDLGLRGGRITFSGGTDLRIALHGVRWVSNATIDGRAVWGQSSGWVTARLTVHPDGGAPVKLTGRWLAFGKQR
jgi:pimeloyl-ACP methyl ester carboxylesterase